MATPHVAGAAALLAAARPGLTGVQLKDLLVSSSKQTPQYDAFQAGSGRVDVPAALGADVFASATAFTGQAEAGDGAAAVRRPVTYTNTGSSPVDARPVRRGPERPDGPVLAVRVPGRRAGARHRGGHRQHRRLKGDGQRALVRPGRGLRHGGQDGHPHGGVAGRRRPQADDGPQGRRRQAHVRGRRGAALRGLRAGLLHRRPDRAAGDLAPGRRLLGAVLQGHPRGARPALDGHGAARRPRGSHGPRPDGGAGRDEGHAGRDDDPAAHRGDLPAPGVQPRDGRRPLARLHGDRRPATTASGPSPPHTRSPTATSTSAPAGARSSPRCP